MTRSAEVKVVLTIAGSDSSGGAGIQADLKAIAAQGAYGATAITALTAQNTVGVQAAQPVDTALVRQQIASVFADLPVHAVKTGMLGGKEVVEAVAVALREHQPPHFVLDPVVRATSGDLLIDGPGLEALRRELLPLATVVTPNVQEAAALSGRPVETRVQAREAAEAILAMGARAVLVTGGDLREASATDLLVSAEGMRELEGERIDASSTHGTGCTFSAAIAALLAQGCGLVDAIGQAKAYVTECIRAGLPLGSGHGPTDPFFFMRRAGGGFAPRMAGGRSVPRLHVITDTTVQQRYSHAELVRLAAAGGADAVQLREKRPSTTRERIDVATAAAEALEGLPTRLVVNDRLDVALACGADGVHLGRDDPRPALARQLLGAQALIGGTANHIEEAVAVAREPVDYLGVGPVFGTQTKAKPAPTLGLEGLRAIVEAVDKPVIAIGNITPDRVTELLDAGAWGVAVVTAVVGDADPAAATRRLRERMDAWSKERGA